METPDFFRSRIDTMINLRHPLAVLATRLPWGVIEAALAPKFERKDRPGQVIESQDMLGPTTALVGAGRSNAGRPRMPIRLMASLLYLKHSFNLSDEEVCERWSENPLWQFFSGQEYYEHRLPCDATQIGRFRRDIGEEGLEQLLKATIDTAVAVSAVKPAALERVTVDTTVQEKAIAHPVDSRLLEIARHKVVSSAKRCGIQLKQTFAKECKQLRRKAGGYAHAKQFRRLKRTVKRQRTVLGIVMREVRRKLDAPGFEATHAKALSDLTMWLERAERVRTQKVHDKNKLYALHAPEVECIGKVQGAQALRVRRQGCGSGLTSGRVDAGSTQLPWQPLRRPHPQRRPRADDEPAAGRGGEDQGRGGRPRLQGRGRRQPGRADHPSRQVQEPGPSAKGLAATAPGDRAGHRASEGGSPHGPMLAEGGTGRRIARHQLRSRLQPALAAARDRQAGHRAGFFVPASNGAAASDGVAVSARGMQPHTVGRLR
jgi:hypothetical protein